MQFNRNPILSVLSIILAWYCLVFSGDLSIDLTNYGVEIPITMQSLAILIIGGLLGPYLSLVAVILYIISGVFGFTTFANNAYGWSVLYGKTGGFLVAFIPAVFFIGWYNNPKEESGFKKTGLGVIIASLIILVLGYLRLLKFLDWDVAFTKGILPFLPGAIFKGLVAFFLLSSINRVIQLRE
jgi:biotin transport system substrate-specific component